MDTLIANPGKYPDHDKLIINHYMWIDDKNMVVPPGKNLRELPPTERKGYGQILANFQEAVDLAYQAFQETSLFYHPETKVKLGPKMEKREHDTRATYMIIMDIATYKAGGEHNGRLWRYIQERREWPTFDGFQIIQTWTFPKTVPEEDRNRVVQCLKTDWMWEEIIKQLPTIRNEKTKEDENILNTPAGPIRFELRRPGGGDKSGI